VITPEQVPDEVVKTLEQALLGRPLSARNCTAAIAAALNAWPGTGHCHRDEQIARLRAEVEKVGRDYNTLHDAHDDWVRESERLRVEVKKMRADIAYADKHASKVEGLLWGTAKENEKLRAALEEIIQDSFSVYAIQVARAALEEK